MPFACGVAADGFEGAPNTLGFCATPCAVAGGPDGFPKTLMVVLGWGGCEGAPNGLGEELVKVNGFFAGSGFEFAKGFEDMVAEGPNGGDVVAGANGFDGAGEGDLLEFSSLLSVAMGFANRTCLLTNDPRGFPLPPLPLTVAP